MQQQLFRSAYFFFQNALVYDLELYNSILVIATFILLLHMLQFYVEYWCFNPMIWS